VAAPFVCLMYHDIIAGPAVQGGGPARFSVPVDEFRRQLEQLRADGRRGVTLREALREASGAVAITFDDGDAGQYERGFRTLVHAGMTATFFVTTDWIDTPGYVTWQQLREMRAAGMDIQSHSRSHPFLSELDGPALQRELHDSREALNQGLGQDTDMIALPGGDWPRRALRPMLREAGYRVVATSRWGINTATTSGGVIEIRRCTVQGVAGRETFGRIAAADPAMGRQRRLREGTLGSLRRLLGPTRYARWRRAVLNLVG
jgi:peptidoglycan/xylan/chitin deacetylase (PgdA/CDA1 family)